MNSNTATLKVIGTGTHCVDTSGTTYDEGYVPEGYVERTWTVYRDTADDSIAVGMTMQRVHIYPEGVEVGALWPLGIDYDFKSVGEAIRFAKDAVLSDREREAEFQATQRRMAPFRKPFTDEYMTVEKVTALVLGTIRKRHLDDVTAHHYARAEYIAKTIGAFLRYLDTEAAHDPFIVTWDTSTCAIENGPDCPACEG